MIVTPFAQVRFPCAPHLTCLIAVNGSKRWLISAVNLSSSPPSFCILPSSFLLLLSLPRCPSIPQVLASLRTVRSNFTILANVTTPTNKSVSCCQTPLPPSTYARHDCLLSLQCVYANASISLLPWGNTLAIMINQFMMTRRCSVYTICIIWHVSSKLSED